MKIWFDKHKFEKKEFEVGDLVLKWDHPHDEKGKHTKFKHLWIVPFHRRKFRPLNIQVTRSVGVGREPTSKWFRSQTLFFLMLLILFSVH